MPDTKHQALSAAKIRNLKTPGIYSDGYGLTLRVDANGNRRWFQRVRMNGKRRNIGLGSYPGVGLKEARDASLANIQAIEQGKDPLGEKWRVRENAMRPAVPTFRQAAEQAIELRRPAWSSDRHAKQWKESLTNHAYPLIGRKPVDQITTADTLAVLTPIWVGKAETATRVRQRMETVFDWCIAQGWRTDNPASTAIAKALPPRPRLKQHYPALPYADVPGALQSVRESNADAITRLAFEFLVLCAARANEVRGMEWPEVDFYTATWTVPARRMKARREHRVPLSSMAVAVLKKARAAVNGQGLVFPAKRTGKALTNMSFAMLLRRLDIPAVPHGFRSSFRDWVIEQTTTPWTVGEAALAHNLGNSTETAYARTDLFERRRVLMAQWADYLASGEVSHE